MSPAGQIEREGWAKVHKPDQHQGFPKFGVPFWGVHIIRNYCILVSTFVSPCFGKPTNILFFPLCAGSCLVEEAILRPSIWEGSQNLGFRV